MKATEARKITDSYNRKKHRKYIIGQYKSIEKGIKKAAKRGESYLSFSPSKYRYENGFDIPIRLFRVKNPDFEISIKDSAESISIIIKW